jgi:D-glycero-D-manno-heptose 1,7-bisphosphate phosphatase
MRTAVFLDRDGTINQEVAYLHDPADLTLIPHAPDAIRALNQRGILAILVTNQAGIGRGLYSEAAMHRVHAEMVRRLAAEGCHLDDLYFCPHRPDEACSCRKPAPGMLLQAAQKHALDLAACYMIGDKITDVEAGHAAGCQTILVLTGYGEQEQKKGTTFQIDFIARDLLEAVQWINQQVEKAS